MSYLVNECASLCIAVHPKCFTIMWGGLSSTTTSVQHPLVLDDATVPQDNGASALTTHQLQVEMKER